MASQCSVLKQAIAVIGLFFSLAQCARHGHRHAAPSATADAVLADRHSHLAPPQHLRAATPALPAQLELAARKASQDPEHPEASQRILDDITRMKVEQCVHLKKAHAEDFEQFDHCLDLLKEVCHPGSDMTMDGDHEETPSGEGFCKTYFEQSKRMALESAKKCVKAAGESQESEEYKKCVPFMMKLCQPGDDMMMDQDKKEKPTGEGFCQKFFPQKDEEKNEKNQTKSEEKSDKDEEKNEKNQTKSEEKSDKDEEKSEKNKTKSEEKSGKGEGEAEGKEAGTAKKAEDGGASGGAAGGEKGADGAGGGQEGADGAKVEEGDGKSGADDTERLHMKESKGVPEQGFEGPVVTHDDDRSHTGDWNAEYGPNHPSAMEVEEICKQNPGNRWCKYRFPKHGGRQPCKSAAAGGKAFSLVLALPVAALLSRATA